MRKNIVLGISLAPLASGLVQGVLAGHWAASVVALAFAYPFAVIVGLPVFFLLENNNKTSLPHLLAAGFVSGTLIGVFFTSSGSSLAMISITFGIFAAHGTAVAFVFWFIALRGKCIEKTA